MIESKLTPKQKLFVECYDGNATDAARKAGYKGNEHTLHQIGHENMRKPEIFNAIQCRRGKEKMPLIASRQDRQKFWTDVMNDQEENMRNRLRAAELLGKSEADFIDKQVHDGGITLNIIRKRYDGADY